MQSNKFDCAKWRKSERLQMKSDSRRERRIQPFLDRLQGVSPASVMDLGTGAGVLLRRDSRRGRDDGLKRATQTVTGVSFFDPLLFFSPGDEQEGGNDGNT